MKSLAMKIGAPHIKLCHFLPLFLAFIIIIFAFFVRLHGYGITYQISNSMPRGLYLIKPIHFLRRNDIVIFHPPTFVLKFLRQKKLTPPQAILMKIVTGIPGDYVCKKNHQLWINQQYVAPVYTHTENNELLPNKKFCNVLGPNQYLLISNHVPRSFDSRYFGAISKKQIIGQAIKV